MNIDGIGLLIAQTRKERGWTQKELAECLHVSDKTVSKWETGRGVPDVPGLENLSSVLGVSVNEFLAGKRFELSEFPKESDSVLVHTMRCYRKVWVLLFAVVLIMLIVVILSFFGYQRFTTFAEDDTEMPVCQSKKICARQSGSEKAEPQICVVEKQGAYMVSLVWYEDAYYAVTFLRDSVFENRWHIWGGTSADIGKLGSYHVKVGANPTLVVVFGSKLPENAAYYAAHTEKTYFSLDPITEH